MGLAEGPLLADGVVGLEARGEGVDVGRHHVDPAGQPVGMPRRHRRVVAAVHDERVREVVRLGLGLELGLGLGLGLRAGVNEIG